MRVFLLVLLLLEFGFAKKVALVIGNSNYAKGYLANPINDAKLIRDILEDKLKFDVTYKTDLSKYEMEKAVRSFSSSIGSSDIALFYYAGHGMQYNSLNYLIPLKANAVTEGQIPSVGVDINYVLGGMERAKLAIVLLDACRNNPFSRSFSRGGTRGLAQVSSNQQNYIISYATEAGAETQDGNGANSPYALALKEYLTKPLEVSTLLKKVKNRVAGTTSPRQVPYVDDRYVGEYRLSSGGGGSCSKVVRTPARYTTVQERILVTQEGVNTVDIPIKYGWGTEKIKVKDGSEMIVTVPAQYKFVKERIEISPNHYQTIHKKILVHPATSKTIKTPPIYTTVKVKKIIKPATSKEIIVPATYKTITKKVLVTPASEKTVSVPCSEVE